MSWTTPITILVAGVVLWWFIRPGGNGVHFLTGLIADAVAFVSFLFGERTPLH